MQIRKASLVSSADLDGPCCGAMHSFLEDSHVGRSYLSGRLYLPGCYIQLLAPMSCLLYLVLMFDDASSVF